MKKLLPLLLLLFAGCPTTAPDSGLHVIDIKSFGDMHRFFDYDPGRDIVISGHRGGMETGFPENCIASFENTLTHTASFFEIDPRLTKDSVIVLMHDRTIDRTTNGTGKVSDYTFEELRRFRLKDEEGNVTDFVVPTLEEVIEWSKGKTILNLDRKDVPPEMTADLLEKTGAVNVMMTVHAPEQALYYLARNPQSMFSAHIFDMETLQAYEDAGVPWNQVMAYVGKSITPEKEELCSALRARGVMCMISVAPTHDKNEGVEEKQAGYRTEIATGPDVIETDYPSLFVGLSLTKQHR